MSYQHILADLLARVEGAVGVLFLDDSGETVDLSCSEHTPYQMRVLGAYLGIYMRQLEKVLEGNRMGGPRMIHVHKDALHIFAHALPEGYYLVLVQRQPAVVATAQRALAGAASELERSLFAA